MRNIFFRHQCLNFSEILRDPRTYPQDPAKRLYLQILAPKIKCMAQKFKYLAPKLKYVAPKLEYVAPTFKYLTPNSNQPIFVPLKSSRFAQRKIPTPTASQLVFWFLVLDAATQLATQLRQGCIQVVRSNKEARKRLTESNGTPTMDLGHKNVVLK